MLPNNYIKQKCNEESFFRAWVEFLTPFHKLAPREKDVAARILIQYFTLREHCEDVELLKELLWTQRSRQDMMDSLHMTREHFKIVLTKLRTAEFLRKDGSITPCYIPHKREGETRFALEIVFDWSSAAKPVAREEE